MTRPCGRRAALLGALLLPVLALGAAPASAHQRGAGQEAVRGLELPAISHDEMRIVAAYRPEILDLAARRARTDEAFRRILNFQNVQFAYCLWGLAPGSVADEASPFNECSHAYLAAAKALLVNMAEAPEGADARALSDRVRRDVEAAPTLICRFGAEPFDTASVVYPDLKMAVGHAPTATAGLAASLLAGGLALFGIGMARRGRTA